MITKKLKILKDHKFRAHEAVQLDDKRIYAMVKGIVDTLKLYECEKTKSNLPMPDFSEIVDDRKIYEVSMGEKSNICAVFTLSNCKSVFQENQPIGFYPVIENNGYDLSAIADAFYVGLPTHDRDLIYEFMVDIFTDIYDHSQWDNEKNEKCDPPKEIAVIVYIDELVYSRNKG